MYKKNSGMSNLRTLRVLMRKNQLEIATRLGVSRAAISHWETGKRRPNLENTEKLRQIFPELRFWDE